MKRLAICAAMIVVISVCTAGSARAKLGNYVDGNQLYEWCRTIDGPEAAMDRSVDICVGYVAGVNDAATQLEGLGAIKGDVACLPSGVSLAQLATVAAKHLKDHPEKRHWAASMLVLEAINLAFPC
jgi:Rap1a immunity proteins